MNNILHLEGDLLTIKGATKVASSTTSQAVVERGNEAVIISGTSIEVKKLSLDEGEVTFFGKFSCIKFGEAGSKKSLMKKIFK